ncbi:ThuA domain-containing protein [Xenophilus arseniciresistens]|uniref:ThuA domain-containing protein n=1 Tax=Xenophilus arseniciresistens TaxID=1283306 RepID=A0AAE3N9I1_9BURK|nr:ThuA domain-containing protein [Xenophilus arseniciresistens]MDA7416771.1 ThuA domain-containing protein [Xenophilus arseniciresistens]
MAQATSLTFKLAAVAAVAMALGACGGGGGGGTSAEALALIAAAQQQQQQPPTTTPPTTTPPDDPAPEPEPTPEDEPFFDAYYNVCRGTSAKCYNDWGAFASTPNRVLIYSRTAGPRHANLGTPMAAGLNPTMNADNVMQAGLKRMLEAEGITVDWTEDVTVLSGRINNYKTVIFASSNRDTLWNDASPTSKDAARTSLRNYMRRGGGFVGLHNAFGAEYNWPYYEGLLGNANFYNHGPNRAGDVEVMAADDPSMAGLPERFTFQDEWYNLEPFPTQVKFLMKVDTSTLKPLTSAPHPGHEGFHPVAWCQYYDGGRAWLTTLGHNANSFTETSTGPGAEFFQKMVVQGVKSTMGLTDFCTSATAAPAAPAAPATPAAPAAS